MRSAVDATARHISKLVVSFEGQALPKLKTAVKKGPNALQTWSQFLYQLATIYRPRGDPDVHRRILPMNFDRNIWLCDRAHMHFFIPHFRPPPAP